MTPVTVPRRTPRDLAAIFLVAVLAVAGYDAVRLATATDNPAGPVVGLVAGTTAVTEAPVPSRPDGALLRLRPVPGGAVLPLASGLVALAFAAFVRADPGRPVLARRSRAAFRRGPPALALTA